MSGPAIGTGELQREPLSVAMPTVWTDRHRGHATDGGYWLGVHLAGDEEPERGDLLREQLVAAGSPIIDAPDLGLAPVLAVHDERFVDCMRRAYPEWVAAGHLQAPGQPLVVPYVFALQGFAARARRDRPPTTIRAEIGLYATDTMTLLGAGTFDAACAAVHVSVHAADLLADGLPAAFAAVRPPGHHAGPAFFGGACYFNNAAAAAQHLRTRGVPRVAIVDIDAHQGNGTQEIFWDRGDVLYASLHIDPGAGWYPHFVGYADEIGGGAGAGATLNVPLPAGAGDDQWLAGLATIVDAVRAHGGEALVVSLGVDAEADDPNSPLAITPVGFRAAGRLLGALQLPTVFVQEGGYNLGHFAALVCAVLHGFEETHG